MIAAPLERIVKQKNLLITNNLNETARIKINKIDKIIFFICVIDILFFPYIRIVSASLSMMLLPIWYLFNLKKIKLSFEFKITMLLVSIVILSVSLFTINSPYSSLFMSSNITNSVILLIGFLYYFFFKYYFENNHRPLKKLLMLYTTFGTILAGIYLASPSLYFQVRSFWTLNGNSIEVNDSLTIHRFTSTFSDPNNAAVAFVAIMTFLLLNQKTNLLQSVFAIGATTIIVSATMSSTGFILLALSLSFYFARLILTKKLLQINRATLLYLSIMFLLAPFLVWMMFNFAGSDVAQLALERVSNNSAESRTDRWLKLLESENIFKYILYGMGGTIIVDGIAFKPHNGHLHLIYNYGMVVYAIFIYIYFRKRKHTSWHSHFFLVPFFLGFTVNVGIYEPRFITLLALLVASYASSNKETFDTIRQQYPLKR